MFGRANEKPYAPLNLAADFAGGGLLAAYAITAALFERQKTDCGQVLDLSLAEGLPIISNFSLDEINFFSFHRIRIC
jgi:alpha-methylacyl-CoA racemase